MPKGPSNIVDKAIEGNIKEFVNLYLNAVEDIELEGDYSLES
jgi:hypothetical protein